MRPLDEDTTLDSVRKASRALLAHEAWTAGGFGAEAPALIADKAFLDLDAPVRRLGAPDVPMPCNDALERATIPSVEEDYGSGSEACGVPATRRSPICPSTRASRSLTSETP